MFKKLYAYTKSGALKEWSISTLDDVISVTYGKYNGKMQTQKTTVLGKNIGKSNETTPQQQAVKGAQSKWNAQVKKGYCTDKDNIVVLCLPMLALDYKKHGHRITFPAYVSTKLDGLRCISSTEIDFKTRGGGDYPVIDDIADELRLIRTKFDIKLDGELYSHGMSLQNIESAILTPSDNTKLIEYHIFDIADTSMALEDRIYMMQQIENEFPSLTRIKFVHQYLVPDEEAMIKWHDEWYSMGYEGVMARNCGSYYVFNYRSADLQKYKLMQDAEFLCRNVTADKHGQAVLIFDEFNASWKGSREVRRHIAQNPEIVIDKYIKVQFQGFTDSGIPQFPVALMVREVDNNGDPLY